ncbi:hypothetical protein CL628_04145 [bacterium]|nr:hypothetical protein [bacterium]
MEKTFAIDFDGVIHAYSRGWQASGDIYDKPIPGAREAMANLVSQGFQVAILTARLNPKFDDAPEQKKKIITWLAENEFAEGVHYHEVTNNKPSAIAYIDDRAVRFTNWDQTNEVLHDLVNKGGY